VQEIANALPANQQTHREVGQDRNAKHDIQCLDPSDVLIWTGEQPV
jgi:hypothetical protein